jgi:hypothetical protein
MQPRPGDVETLGYGSGCLYVFPTLASLLIPKWFPLLKMVGTTLASPIAQIKTAAPRRLHYVDIDITEGISSSQAPIAGASGPQRCIR